MLSDVDAHGLCVEGELAAADLAGVGELSAHARRDAVGESNAMPSASARLEIRPGSKPRHWLISGEIDATVPLVCQRCLEIAEVRVGGPVVLAVVDPELDEEALVAKLPDAERWDHEGDELTLAELIDEWILLGLPMVAMHENQQQCGALATAAERPAPETGTQKPFADLASLLQDKTS